MTDTNIRALYGLKYNPFLPNTAHRCPMGVMPAAENFAHRVKAMISQGGFALITGDPGTRKKQNPAMDR